MDELEQALAQLLAVAGVFKTEGTQPHPLVVDAVAIEVDDFVGVFFGNAPLEGGFHGGKGGRLQHIDLDQGFAQVFYRLYQGQGADAVVDIADGVVVLIHLGARANQQHPNGQVGLKGLGQLTVG